MNQKIGEIIAANRRRQHLSQSELAAKLRDYNIYIKNAAVSAWEKNINMPTACQLLALCRIQNITNIYDVFIGPNPSDPFFGLNEEGKRRLSEYAELLRLSDRYREKKPDILSRPARKMKVSLLSASAGTGDYLDEENFDEIDVYTPVPVNADFGVYLNGDSMEPRFQNDELVWFEKTDTIENDEFGLFCLNGSTYFKKYRTGPDGTFLLSLNSKYKPVHVREFDSLRVFARLASDQDS